MPSITTPVTVVNMPYITSGNGGRRLVRLSNGWLVAAATANSVDNYRAYLYKSVDDGQTWEQLCWTEGGAYQLAIASYGTIVYCLFVTSAGGTVFFVKFDATTVSNTALTSSVVATSGLISVSEPSLTISPEGTLHAIWTAISGNYPNSRNIQYSKSTDDGQTWAVPTQVTKRNASGFDHTKPTIVVKNADPFIIAETNMASRPLVVFSPSLTDKLWDTSAAWGNGVIFAPSSSAYPALSPCALVKKYGSNVGRIFAGWHGLDATDNTKQNVRVAYSDDGGVTWTVIGKITTGNTVDRKNVTLSEDANGNVYAIYEDNGTIKFQVCPNGTTAFGDLTTIEAGTNPSALESGAFAAVPVIYKNATGVRFYGSFNNQPTLTLTNPTDNQTLSEGNVFSVQGSAGDTDNGNVMTVKFQINNGPIRAIASGVSDGVTPISFARTLTYHNKRLWDGAMDVAGADLAEDVDHILKVWAEDDQGGKSAEVTRKFRVIWNRPPTISGTNEDLGTIMEPPSKTYSVTDPEGNPFTIIEKIDGKVIRSFEGVPGREETVTIPHDMWIRLDLDTPHELTIEATDNNGMTSTRTYTFVRTETHIEFMLDFDNPDVEAHFTLDGMPKRVLVTLDRYLPPGSQIEFVRVTNNAMDETPTWEDATAAVTAGRGYLFTNQQKTAANWRINIWVRIAKGTATERVRLDGFGGAFD